MLKEFASVTQVYLVTGYTDLSRGIDGLAEVVHGKLELDPYSQALFLFCGRKRDRIKGLLWEGDGFLLLYKRLDNGGFRWPRNETEAKFLTEQEADVNPKAVQTTEVKAHKRVKRTRDEIMADLPVEEVFHEAEDKTCDKCCAEMTVIGKEKIRDELVYVHAQLFIRRHVAEVVKCTHPAEWTNQEMQNFPILRNAISAQQKSLPR